MTRVQREQMYIPDEEDIIRAEIFARLDETTRRIEKDPDNWKQWIDQTYGFILGISYGRKEKFQENIGAIWNEWYRNNHPAYR